jgi:hypothetical protein
MRRLTFALVALAVLVLPVSTATAGHHRGPWHGPYHGPRHHHGRWHRPHHGPWRRPYRGPHVYVPAAPLYYVPPVARVVPPLPPRGFSYYGPGFGFSFGY